MSLDDTLAAVLKMQRQLQNQVQEARREAKFLEEENERLRRQLSAVGNGDYQQIAANGQRIQQTALENLLKLYGEGFHICHLSFGQGRDGECLFCQGFLAE